MQDMIVPIKFKPGLTVITRAALLALQRGDVLMGLTRHLTGDWGELEEEDLQENERALVEGLRLFSRYVASDGTVFWIITEHDRSTTMVLLPADY